MTLSPATLAAYTSVVVQITLQSSLIALLLLAVVRLGRRWPSPLRYGLLLLGLVRFALPPLPALPTGVLPMAGRAMPASLASIMQTGDPAASPLSSAADIGELNNAHNRGQECAVPGRMEGWPSTAQAPGAFRASTEPGALQEIQTAPVAGGSAGMQSAWPWVHAGVLLFLLTWAARQLFLLHRLCVGARRVEEADPLHARFRLIAGRMGIRNMPALLIHDGPIPPMALGLWRRRVVIPAALLYRLEPRELEAVLAHELAHHRRGDLWVNWVQLLLTGAWWFNPVLWLLNRSIRRVREECCDDLVLALREADADAYGQTLVHVARELVNPTALSGGALGFAPRLHPLGGRIRRIMDCTLRRSARLSLTGVVILAAAALAVLPGFAARPTDSTAEQKAGGTSVIARGEMSPLPKTVGDGTAVPGGESSQSADAKAAASSESQKSSESQARRIVVTVLDATTNQPIEGVEVTLRGNKEEQVATTGAEGRGAAALPSDIKQNFSIRATKRGFIGQSALFEGHLEEPPPIPEACTLRLTKAEPIRARVTDTDGKPIADVAVELNLREPMRRDGVPLLSDSFRTTTDAEGWFEVIAKPASPIETMEMWLLRMDHPAFLPAQLNTMKGSEPLVFISRSNSVPLSTFLSNQAVFRLEPDNRKPFQITGRVDDPSAQPLASVRVSLASSTLPKAMSSTETGPDGRYVLEAMPPREPFELNAILTVEKDGYAGQAKLVRFEAVDHLDFKLNPTDPVRGLVVDADSKPVEGASVALAVGRPNSFPRRAWHWATKTGPDGRFECLSPAEGPLNLQVSKGDLQTFSESGTFRNSPLTVTLGARAFVEGRVTRKSDGALVPQFTAVLGSILSEGSVGWDTGGMIPAPFHDGAYRLEMPARYTNGLFKVKVEADGFRTVESPVFQVGTTSLQWDVALDEAGSYAGRILDATGAPVDGARVYGWVGDANDLISVRDLVLEPPLNSQNRTWECRTNAAGEFVFRCEEDPAVLLVIHKSGSVISYHPSTSVGHLKLEPWAWIEGRVFNGHVPDAARVVRAWTNAPHEPKVPDVSFSSEAKSDDAGRFTLMCHAGQSMVSAMCWVEGVKADGYRTPDGFRNLWMAWMQLEPGEHSSAEFGRGGRAVAGRIIGIDGQPVAASSDFELDRVFPEQPESVKSSDGSINREAYDQWINSRPIRAHMALPSNYRIQLDQDGRFRIENVVPGRFFVSGYLRDPRDFRGSLGRADSEHIYEIPPADGPESFDLGDIRLLPPHERPVELQVGQPAPEFTVTTLDGKRVSLSELKGKVVLLDFWATWCGPCIRQVPFLTDLHERFGKREDFVMIGLSLDKTVEDLKRGIDEHKLSWPQAMVIDEAGEKIKKAYGVEGIPHMVIVGKSGLIECPNTFGDMMATAIEAALVRPAK